MDSSEEINLKPKEALMLYTGTNFLLLGSKYAIKSVKTCKEILKDEDLLANDKPEVLEFKKNLTTFLDTFESNKDLEKTFDSLEMFGNITDHYLELTEENYTPETKFIARILNKYNVKDMETDFIKDFNSFIEQFKILFEAAKIYMENPILEWYEEFLTIDDFEKKLDSFVKFIELV